MEKTEYRNRVSLRRYGTKRISGRLFLAAGLIMTVLLSLLAGCGRTESKGKQEDKDGRLTMYVGLGNTSNQGEYYRKLHEMLLEDTGIDVKFIYSNTLDTSNAVLEMLEHGDLPADIVITAASTSEDIQKEAFLDLAAYTNIPDLFTPSRIQSIALDGGVYQLPFTSRLIGVEYNKTLMEEMGWEVPGTLEEMIRLKEKADAAGIPFAVSGGVATGHGFNYLFYLMGSQYLSSADGTEWLEEYLSGQTSIRNFAQQTDYFETYAQAGLFGQLHDEDWNAWKEFSTRRALFYYNIVNDATGFEGETEDGKQVQDEYASMPWLSENGSSNCFAVYDSMYLGLDKKLGEEDQKEKLSTACQLMEYLTTEPAVELFCSLYSDGYVSTSSFNIDATRIYADSAEGVHKGYLMPWYYNYFDSDSIVNVGELVNQYLKQAESTSQQTDEKVSMEDILAELDLRNQARLTGVKEVAAVFETDLSYEDSARLQASANALAAQSALKELGMEGEVTVSLMPYVESLSQLPLFTQVAVQQTRYYAGEFVSSRITVGIPAKATNCAVLRIDGEELNRIIHSGFTVKTEKQELASVSDSGEYVFSYAAVQKGASGKTAKFKNSESYLVAVPLNAVAEDIYNYVAANDGVLLEGTETETLSTENALQQYFTAHSTVRAEEIGF